MIVEEVYREGHINTLLGPPGSGKTNCAIALMEKAVALGFYIYTNIHFFEYSTVGEACRKGLLPKGPHYRRVPPEIVTVRSLSQMLLGLLSTEKNIVVLDEAGIFASSTAPMSKKVRELKELAYVIRHLRSSMMLIAQSKGSLSPTLRSELVKYEMRIRKYSKYHRVLSIAQAVPKTDDDGEEIVIFDVIGEISKIPLSNFPFDSFFIPKLDFDLDLSTVFSELGEYDSVKIRRKGSDGLSLGEKIIKELQVEAAKPKKSKTSEAKATREEIINQYKTYVESGKFKRKNQIVDELVKDFGKSFSSIYQVIPKGKMQN